jgi:hypothetical protein
MGSQYVILIAQQCTMQADFNKNTMIDWEQAKAQAECLDYLLEVAVKMRLAGIETVGL